MQHGIGNDINSDTECTEGVPDMDDKRSIDVPCAETWEMGSFNLLFEVTIPIIMYVASVDISCQQRLQCVCKHFNDAGSCCENTSFLKFVFFIRYLCH